jgi:hypothetical protein
MDTARRHVTRGAATPDAPPNGDARSTTDEERSSLWIKVHRLSFTVNGKEAPAGYRMRLPADLFDQPPGRIDDIRIRVAAPLALYQMREGIAAQGSFGEPSERQRESARALREERLSGMTDAELEPTVEQLTIDPG